MSNIEDSKRIAGYIDYVQMQLRTLQLANVKVRSIAVSFDLLMDKEIARNLSLRFDGKRSDGQYLLGYPLKIIGDASNTIAFEIA